MKRPNKETIKPENTKEPIDCLFWYAEYANDLEKYCDYLEQQLKNRSLDDVVPILKQIASVIDESVESAGNDPQKWQDIYEAVELLQAIAEDNSMLVRN